MKFCVNCLTPDLYSSHCSMSAQENRVMDLTEWLDRWQEERIHFHQLHVHNMLESNIEKVLCGRKGVRFFFPLCGKAVDMKWLADMGHSVVGVEISEKAIKQFFEEQKLSYSEESVPEIPTAKLFESSDGKISIYQCDVYKLCSTITGQFGGIWDRGSLVAINPCDRQRYSTLIMSLMDKDCRYLLDTVQYNPELHKGPPFFVSDEDVKNLYGKTCDIHLLDSADALTDRQKADLDSSHCSMSAQENRVMDLTEWEDGWQEEKPTSISFTWTSGWKVTLKKLYVDEREFDFSFLSVGKLWT
ncbi:hypothetical protein AAFF_G00166020 [Aldrovandia affinis]|uniref:thiopurine S-methyltransferase n=1 Tax=Aldrovandia affinis TaxID=143900 RepID=A0AAD7RME4_9TELE|nr:hypothetical protein AAFF_G00166020 [Aldrovandia affinis]